MWPDDCLLLLFLWAQLAYTASLGFSTYLRCLPVNRVDMAEAARLGPGDFPYIVLFYPVLRELEATMRTTCRALARLDYPRDRFRVVAIPNADDEATIRSLLTLATEFPFLEILEVPPTADPRWQVVWDAWDGCDKAYWWHRGRRAGRRDLPAKKTRQLVFAFYTLAREMLPRQGDFLVDYIDADSCPPPDHFLAAAVGIRHYDVLQATNIAGNLNQSLAASLHAMDHMAWDGQTYPHLSADGRQPYWVLGKGLFYKASDLVALGGFHPWLTIEDPEVGMRFWVNGRRLGIIEAPLIEEVPVTFARGVRQRTRWVAGFFQSLTTPTREMGMTRGQRARAWLVFLPCLSMSANSVGLPAGAWAFWHWWQETGAVPPWLVWLCALNVAWLAAMLASQYRSVWRRSALVLGTRRERIAYLMRVNPVVLIGWWLFWIVPLAAGFRMFVRDGGLVWERTVKINANNDLILEKTGLAAERLGV
jgi:cellulose synthase/poly-beta-1,6-N-acetylglucosamine synthase-like glycosyltransferase